IPDKKSNYAIGKAFSQKSGLPSAQSVDEFLLFIKWEFVFLFFVLVFMTSLDFDAQKLKN
uniref:hypothetical protein n=1 Tax=uncultured Dubosiella sp. TaxID=1937011 RepID=UPI00272AF5A1